MLLVKMTNDKGRFKKGQLIRATEQELNAEGIKLYEDCSPEGTYLDDAVKSDLAPPDAPEAPTDEAQPNPVAEIPPPPAELPPENTATIQKTTKKKSKKKS